MLTGRRSPVSENHRSANVPISTKKSQIQRLGRGWGCGSGDGLMKLPSLAPDSATRFFRTVSFRLKTHSVKSHLNRASRKATPLNTQVSTSTEDSQTTVGGGGSPAETVQQTTSSSKAKTGNDRMMTTTTSGESERLPRTGNDQALPSGETGRGFAPRSLSVAAFFRRVQSSYHPQTPKVEHGKRAKDDSAFRSTPSVRATSDKDDAADSGWKGSSFFRGIGSMRSQNRNGVNYKSLDDGNRPQEVDNGRRSFRQRLKKEVHRSTLQTGAVHQDEDMARPSRSARETRGAVSDGEEETEEQEHSQSSKGGQPNRVFRFQRSSTLWRSFSSKSRTRSNDVLLQTTEPEEQDSGCSLKEDIEQELKLLCDLQQHRHGVGFLGAVDGLQNLLAQPRSCVDPLERRLRSDSSDVSNICPSPGSGSSPTKMEMPGLNDQQRYRHTLDGLYEFNVAHEHYTEAAFALCEHAQLCSTSGFREGDGEGWRRGEQLLLRAVEEFDLGKGWEYAIDICEYFSKIYKAAFMYAELSQMLRKQANLYRKILQEPRAQPSYFIVHFVGGDFPEVLTNKRFVLRTEVHEDEYDLSRIIGNEFNGAVRLRDDLDGPHETTATDIGRGYRLFKLKPVSSVSVSNPGSRKVPDAVQFFHRYYNIRCFEVIGSYEGESKSVVSIESSLPAVSRWAQVIS